MPGPLYRCERAKGWEKGETERMGHSQGRLEKEAVHGGWWSALRLIRR